MLHEPAATAVATPEELTVAMAVLLLLHAPVPPLNTTVFAVYCDVAPTHNDEVPVTDATLAAGLAVTVTGVLVTDGHAALAVQVRITWPLPLW